MRTPSDPTRRLRALSSDPPQPMRNRATAYRESAESQPDGWVPHWTAAIPDQPNRLPDNAGRPRVTPLAGWDPFEDRPDETASAPDAEQDLLDSGLGSDDDPRPRRRRRKLPGAARLKQRWVPEPLHDARIDPGPRGAWLLSAIAAVAAIAAALGVWLNLPTPQELPPAPLIAVASEVLTSEPVATSIAPTATAPVEILVSVTGKVISPGLVRLSGDARVADAIAAAGGAQDGVDLTGLNLAARLADGDSVVVGEVGQGVSPDAAVTDPGGAVPGGAGDGALVNLNTADTATLETLPGVGPVMAENIIAWRETNGPFTSIDQLQEVTGIGPSRFATLAPLVMV